MGHTLKQVVATGTTGWWGRLGLWVARHVFRLDTRVVHLGPSVVPVGVVEGVPRVRDYILIGATDGLVTAPPTSRGTGFLDERPIVATPTPIETPTPIAAPTTPHEPSIEPSAEPSTEPSTEPSAETTTTDTDAIDASTAVPTTDVEIPTASDGSAIAHPVHDVDRETVVEPAARADVARGDLADGPEVQNASDEGMVEEKAVVPSPSADATRIDADAVVEATAVNVEPEARVATPIPVEADAIGAEQARVSEPVPEAVSEDVGKDAVIAPVGPLPSADAPASVTDAEPAPAIATNRAARRAGKRAALKPLRKPPAPTTPAAPTSPDAITAPAAEIVETVPETPTDVVSVAPAPTLDEATMEEAVIDLPQTGETEAQTAMEIAGTPPRPRRRTPRAANYDAPVDEPTLGFANAIDMHHVLDRLPQYFEHLRMLKDVDAGAYSLFSTLGGQIALDDGTRFDVGGVSAEFLANPPQVRCVFLHSEVDADGVTADDMVPASIIYMMKLAGGQICVNDQSIAMIPADGITYRYVTVMRFKGKPHVATCFVHIDDEGTIRALPERLQVHQAIPGRYHQNSPHTIRHAKVRVPTWIADMAHDNKMDPDAWLTHVVSLCASAKRADDAILVRAHKSGMAAAWTIHRRDAKRFFAARERDEDGRRRRVLHYVASFDRVTASGVQSVREHYRGAREFAWQGYDIEVSGLNFHHKDFFEAPIEQYEDDGQGPPMGGTVSLKKVVRNVIAHYREPFTLSKGRRKAA